MADGCTFCSGDGETTIAAMVDGFEPSRVPVCESCKTKVVAKQRQGAQTNV